MPIIKFAWIPTLVITWRNTRAIVWLQRYYIKQPSELIPLGRERINIGEKYCLKIGAFSVEL